MAMEEGITAVEEGRQTRNQLRLLGEGRLSVAFFIGGSPFEYQVGVRTRSETSRVLNEDRTCDSGLTKETRGVDRG